MREGPLAALFRKTEQDQRHEADTARAGSAETAAGERMREAEPELERRDAPGERQRARTLPHPALSAPTIAAEPDIEEPRVPSPQERLRHAFSSEIPANLLDAVPPRAAAVERERASFEDYAGELTRRRTPSVGQPVIRVVGVGGGGVNAVNRMVEAEVEGIEFVAVNTDVQSLQQSTADITLHIGSELTRGRGSGSDANVGRHAAMEDYDRVKALLKGSDMIFIAAGAGGGTGTGAAPIIARISREIGALTVAIVTKPFGFEGSRRSEQAERGVSALAEEVDTLIVVPNDRLLGVLDRQTAMVEAFRVADDVLRQGVQGISDLVTLPGLINLDFADVRTIMSDAGNALLGIGMGVGENRATDAAAQAVSSPLLETSMEGARSILLSITGGANLSLWEVNEAAKSVSEAAHPDANIIFGAMVDEKLDDQVWVTVVATGYGEEGRRKSANRFREPAAGEVRVQRTAAPATPRERPQESVRRRGLAVDELDVPEFLPNL
ncbi:MAG TPA: cell division protein FtsZ [Solirubrobacteraceae bacterium]|nr:cell division protein FtsZ [Solirubrobacteraceae bacterium]